MPSADSSGINPTILAFGFPDTVLADYRHWVVLLRPQQATLGALVLAARGDATRFSEISPAAFGELHEAVRDIEATLQTCFEYSKINYLMLMMVDLHVHFHVLPRYDRPCSFEGVTFADPGWPKAPDLSHATDLDESIRRLLRDRLRAAWPRS
jgi:diadenosine tetraphosphate (Ap4A) HIT family hydrolase